MKATSTQIRSIIRGVVRQRFGLLSEAMNAKDGGVTGTFDYNAGVKIENLDDDLITYLIVGPNVGGNFPRGSEQYVVKDGNPKSLGKGVVDLTNAVEVRTGKPITFPAKTGIAFTKQSGTRGFLDFGNELPFGGTAAPTTAPSPTPAPTGGTTPSPAPGSMQSGFYEGPYKKQAVLIDGNGVAYIAAPDGSFGGNRVTFYDSDSPQYKEAYDVLVKHPNWYKGADDKARAAAIAVAVGEGGVQLVEPVQDLSGGGTPPEPQASAGSVQDKAAQGLRIVSGQFADYGAEISCDEVERQNPVGDNFTWVESDMADSYGLKNWDAALGDPYRYCALVKSTDESTQGEPVGFVVTKDPKVGITSHDTRASTGFFLCPEAKMQNHRDAFCYLYKRATGRTHPSCPSGAGGGSARTGPTAPGSSGTGGSGGAGGGRRGGSGVIPGRETYGPGEHSALGTPGAIKLGVAGGAPRRGAGDAIPGLLGIGIRPGEKLRGAGTKIVTKSKDNMGFTSFPRGPGRMFYRNPVFAGGGRIPPSGLGVFFQYPMAIVTDEVGLNPFIRFGENKGPENITLIRLGWGSVGRLGLRGKLAGGLTLRPGDVGFDEAARWILEHQEEFDLRPDGIVIEDPMDVGPGMSDVERRVGMLGEHRVRFSRFLR